MQDLSSMHDKIEMLKELYEDERTFHMELECQRSEVASHVVNFSLVGMLKSSEVASNVVDAILLP
eukprot:1160533-Pelagomonas_calceolata.AAC.14